VAQSEDIPENRIGTDIITAAMRVHSVLGPGLLESTYETCLAMNYQSERGALANKSPSRCAMAICLSRTLIELICW